MKITEIKTYMQRVDDRPRVLVAVKTDAGITGWGETYAHGPERAIAPILDYFASHLLGEDPRRVTFLHDKLMHVARFPPGAGGVFRGRSCAVGHRGQGVECAGLSTAGRSCA